MTGDIFGRSDWLIQHLTQVPMLIIHIREQALPSMQASTEGRVSGSKEQTTAPMRIEPLDDADELWAMVCSLAEYLAERANMQAPRELATQWLVEGSVRRVTGLATTNPDRIYTEVWTITQWLRDRAWTLAINPEYQTSVDELVEAITSARRRYPEAPTFQGARHRCPLCGLYAVEPVYGKRGGLEGLACVHCGARREYGGG
ncbi:MAG: hypothetical protein WC829_03235 [Hyphomicrobium sp.]|jgi:hypothetical protein